MWEDNIFLNWGIDSLLSWNDRGLNAPNKQKEVKLLCNVEKRPNYYVIKPVHISPQIVTCEVLELWKDLVRHIRGCTKPWLVLGDFNLVLHSTNRIGGNAVTWAEMMDFQQCMQESGLMEMPTQGNRYTWNDKNDEQRIFSNIDWNFMNGEWLDKIPTCNTRFLAKGISDHIPT
ncbi:uncharacterized protein LOC142163387 [Nicotiana tabacum]|uniref:Uncharacterized protein LOC142163387 n=1 Tax=Nicotiana tabacum TaxID=4097 RepID=A0AC58RVL1_TOBAC